MSDLEQAKAKLIDTIGKYNLTASNIAKFRFNKLEENVFAAMMVGFAQEQANGLEKSTEPALNMQNVSNRRELLIAYGEWIHELAGCKDTEKATKLADIYISNL